MRTDQGENIFVLIKNSDEKSNLFQNLVKNKIEIIAKTSDPESEIMYFTPIGYDHDVLQATLSDKNIKLEDNQELTIQFSILKEKYLTQVFAKQKENYVTLDVSADLFHLQRRADFRLKIPASYYAKFKGKAGTFDLVDISAGGFLILAKKDTSIKKDDKISGELVLNTRNPILVAVDVKHISPYTADGDLVKIGCQFNDLTNLSKQRLIALVMDLYREFFPRL